MNNHFYMTLKFGYLINNQIIFRHRRAYHNLENAASPGEAKICKRPLPAMPIKSKEGARNVYVWFRFTQILYKLLRSNDNIYIWRRIQTTLWQEG